MRQGNTSPGMLLPRPLASLMLAMATCTGQGAPQYHGEDLAEVGWRVFTTPQRCELQHELPRYGRAVFWQVRQDDLQFALHVKQPPVADAHATVRAIPPSWKHHSQPRELGHLPITKGVNPIRTGRQLALRLYYELENGMAPQFYYQDWADGTDKVTVTLSPVHFLEVLAEFLECSRQLPGEAPAIAGNAQPRSAPLIAASRSGAPLRVSSITEAGQVADEHLVHFATDSAELTATAQQNLRRLATNSLSARGQRAVIKGHADRRGTNKYNDKLSAKRARSVRAFLISVGVPAERIETRHFGEKKPLDPADNEGAWAKNRRVSVSLIR